MSAQTIAALVVAIGSLSAAAVSLAMRGVLVDRFMQYVAAHRNWYHHNEPTRRQVEAAAWVGTGGFITVGMLMLFAVFW